MDSNLQNYDSYNSREQLLIENSQEASLNKSMNNRGLFSGSNYDWSKKSLECFFLPLESFLEYQRKREKSSKRRCTEKNKTKAYETRHAELKVSKNAIQ
jgi:hypothetical protein